MTLEATPTMPESAADGSEVERERGASDPTVSSAEAPSSPTGPVISWRAALERRRKESNGVEAQAKNEELAQRSQAVERLLTQPLADGESEGSEVAAFLKAARQALGSPNSAVLEKYYPSAQREQSESKKGPSGYEQFKNFFNDLVDGEMSLQEALQSNDAHVVRDLKVLGGLILESSTQRPGFSWEKAGSLEKIVIRTAESLNMLTQAAEVEMVRAGEGVLVQREQGESDERYARRAVERQRVLIDRFKQYSLNDDVPAVVHQELQQVARRLEGDVNENPDVEVLAADEEVVGGAPTETMVMSAEETQIGSADSPVVERKAPPRVESTAVPPIPDASRQAARELITVVAEDDDASLPTELEEILAGVLGVTGQEPDDFPYYTDGTLYSDLSTQRMPEQPSWWRRFVGGEGSWLDRLGRRLLPKHELGVARNEQRERVARRLRAASERAEYGVDQRAQLVELADTVDWVAAVEGELAQLPWWRRLFAPVDVGQVRQRDGEEQSVEESLGEASVDPEVYPQRAEYERAMKKQNADYEADKKRKRSAE